MEYTLDKFQNEIIQKVQKLLNLSDDFDIPIEIPSQERGDFALPCFAFASKIKKPPVEIAEELTKKIELKYGGANQEGPYVNFSIDEKFLVTKEIKNCLELEDDFGKYEPKNEKILIEHTSANPNGPLHVGRARNPIIGDTMSRIYEMVGYDVERQYFVNDIGRQMAILTWGTLNLNEEELPKPDRKKIDYKMVKYYQKANELLEKNEDMEEEITDIIRSMEKGDVEIFKHFRDNADRVLEGINQSLERLNIHIDTFQNESSFILDGSVDEVIDMMTSISESGKEEGALFFEKDDKKTFLTRSDGTNLYPARDIAYHIWKGNHADRLLNVLGEDHKQHGEFIKNALKALDLEPIPKLLFYSFVTFEGKEMSTRKGTYVTLDEFMDTAHEKARGEILKRKGEIPEDEIEAISEKVGLGSVRFNIIKVQPEKPIDFKWEEALNFQGDSAPFIQYSHARACGILEKWGGDEEDLLDIDLGKLKDNGEVKLVKIIAQFPREIKDAADNDSPHRIAKYALDLASEFNQFYRDYPVLQSSNKKEQRLALVKASKIALRNVLDTLGIEAPTSM